MCVFFGLGEGPISVLGPKDFGEERHVDERRWGAGGVADVSVPWYFKRGDGLGASGAGPLGLMSRGSQHRVQRQKSNRRCMGDASLRRAGEGRGFCNGRVRDQARRTEGRVRRGKQ